MYEKMERYLRVNLLGLGPRLMKNNLPGRGLTKIENTGLRSGQVTSGAVHRRGFFFLH